MEEKGNDEWGEILFTTRSRWSDPQERGSLVVILTMMFLLVVVSINMFNPWLAIILFVSILSVNGFLLMHIIRFPPFMVYRTGITVLPTSDLKALLFGSKRAPWSAVESIELDPDAGGNLLEGLTFTIKGFEGDYRPIKSARYNLINNLSLLLLLTRLVQDKCGQSLRDIVNASEIDMMFDMATRPDAHPEDLIDLDGSEIPYLLIPLIMIIAFFMGLFIHSAQVFYFEYERGIESFDALFIVVVAMIIIIPYIIYPLKGVIRWMISKDSWVEDGRILVKLGRMPGFFFRTEMNLDTIEAVTLNVKGSDNTPFLLIRFSNEEEFILSTKVIPTITPFLEAGDDPFTFTYSRGGRIIASSIIRFRKIGILLICLVFTLVVLLGYLASITGTF